MKNVFRKRRHVFGLIFLFIGGFLLTSGILSYFLFQTDTQVFSPYTLLSSSWEKYKIRFIQNDGRVIDYSQNSVTTSEGQSYALLRAVWSDDKASFDKVWDWTRNNLKRPNDALLGWRWGERGDGSYGFLEDGGSNSASDADQDIALALIFASKRWGQQEYLDEAKKILKDTWDINTFEVQGKRYLLAGNWAVRNDQIILNPSYFSPYAWRVFAQVDSERDWKTLIDPSYEVLDKTTTFRAETESGNAPSNTLPPNWIAISKTTGELQKPSESNLTLEYSFDAVRVPWRIAADYRWSNEERAKQYLTKAFSNLFDQFQQQGRLASVYQRDGKSLTDYESPTMYATLLPAMAIVRKEEADTLFQEKILKLYSTDENSFLESLPYYDQNWLWFGTALYFDQLKPIGVEVS